MNNYIGYYRRSKKEYASTLGLESQKQAVQDYVSRKGGVLTGEYTEIESGTSKNRSKRIIIQEAIKACRDQGAVLVIAKLDRLARDVSFTSDLMNSKLKFVALDIPDANELTIHIMAAMAQHEAKRISERITSALEVKKKRGEPLGINTHRNPEQTLEKGFGTTSLKKARRAYMNRCAANPNNQRAIGYAYTLSESGLSYKAIASRMNGEKFTSPTGKEIKPITVMRWINKYQAA